jgi:excisionase family DNA binding protein
MTTIKGTSLTALVSLADAARLLGVSDKTIRRLVQRGTLRCHRVGRQIRFSEDNLRNYLLATKQ